MYDQKNIMDVLPHRAPFLFIDAVLECNNKDSVLAQWAVPVEMDLLKGHFPEYPIVPGNLITEALAQTAAYLLLSASETHSSIPLLFGIESMRFIRPVSPGSLLEMKAVLIANCGNNLYDFQVKAISNGQAAASGKITLALKS